MSNPAENAPHLEVLFDVPITVTVELGQCQRTMREVLEMKPGSVLQLDKPADAPVDLYVSQRLVARGEIIVEDNQFAIKITELVGKQP